MSIEAWKSTFMAYMVERSDASEDEAEYEAEREIERQREAFGDDPENWHTPEDAAQACMEDWVDFDPAELPDIERPDDGSA